MKIFNNKIKPDDVHHIHEKIPLVSHKHPNPNCADCKNSSSNDDIEHLWCDAKQKEVKKYNKCNFFTPEDHKL